MAPSGARGFFSLRRLLSLGDGAEEALVTGKVEELTARYEVYDELGVGRFGVVREVEERATGKRFACKTIPKESVEDLPELRNEVAILRRVKHPHVLGIVDAFETREEVFLIQERCTGGELFDRIIAEGHFSERDAAVIIRQTLLALEYLHDQLKIVHRDVKPENLLFFSRAKDAPLYLIDFGMAEVFDGADGHFLHSSCGSPSYVAPEVLERQYTEKCDVWSTGVILFILLVGRVPFAGATDDEVMRNVAKGNYNFDDQAWLEVSHSAISLVKQMMCADPAQRLSASAALRHPWVRELGGGADTPLRAALRNIKAFQQLNKLKKMSLEVIARNIAASPQALQSFVAQANAPEADKKYMLRLATIFSSLDTNNEGVISAEDLAEAILNESRKFNAFNVLASAEDLARMLRAIDTDKNKKIDLAEFIAAAVNPAYLRPEHIKLAFDHFDKHKSGGITFEQLQKAYRMSNVELSRADFDRFDLNKDGVINLSEYSKMMRER